MGPGYVFLNLLSKTLALTHSLQPAKLSGMVAATALWHICLPGLCCAFPWSETAYLRK